MTDPIDELHAQCIDARDQIRNEVVNLRRKVAVWRPRPCPPKGG